MIKVVEVISDMNVGGAGRLLVSRIRNSDKHKFKYTVILPKGSGLTPFLKRVCDDIVFMDGCFDRSLDLKCILKLYKIIKNLSPDIVNSHGCMSARIAGKLANVKLNLYTRHCDFPIKKLYTYPFVIASVGFITNILSDGVIAVSHSAKSNLSSLGIDRKRIKVIVNGAEKMTGISFAEKQKIKTGLKIPADAIVVSIFARLEPYKDHITFLRSARVLSNFKNIYFLIVGNGSLELSLKEYAEKLGISERTRFVGFVDDVSPLMNITDINTNCSVGTETSSLALSEGMSLGIPAVASDYCGNKYIVKDRVNGLIFPQRDYYTLAKKILLLVRDKKIYHRLSENSKKRFGRELNSKRMTEETEKYYIEMLKRKY